MDLQQQQEEDRRKRDAQAAHQRRMNRGMLALQVVQVAQNKKLNDSMKKLLVSSEQSVAQLKNISSQQGLMFEEIQKQSDLLSAKEKREAYQLAVTDVAFQMINELERIEKLSTNLEKFLHAASIVQKFSFLDKEISKISSLDEKLTISKALKRLRELSNEKTVHLSDAEYVVLGEIASLEKQRAQINKIRDTGQKYRNNITRVKSLPDELKIAELKIPQKRKFRFAYWHSFALYLGALMLSGVGYGICFVSASLILLIRILTGLTGLRKKSLQSEAMANKQMIEDAVSTFETEQMEQCDKELKKKYKKVIGKELLFSDYGDFTKSQNASLTQEFKKIKKNYPSLRLKSAKA